MQRYCIGRKFVEFNAPGFNIEFWDLCSW